ncbi:MAG: primosomal protein N' [Deltaproteobacteria bacterium]|nr:primosomal protein N' [Deltaproteobacteria bacterium]
MTPKSLEDAGAQEAALLEVAVALPLFHTLTYRVPPRLISAQVGCLVKVPVGRRHTSGYLLGPAREIPEAALKDVTAILDPLPRFGPDMVPFFRWLAEYYHYPLGEALRQIIPGGEKPTGPKTERWAAAAGEAQTAGESAGAGRESALRPPAVRLGPRERALLQHLQEHGPSPVRELNRIFSNCQAVLRRLAGKGLVSLENRSAFRDPLADHPVGLIEESLTLTEDQQRAVKEVSQGLASGAFAPFLLHGVTASGKTEVYLAAAAECLAQGRQVLVLLPEIALTHPVAWQFNRRFGDRVTLLHSGMSDAARLDQWRRIMQGEVDVLVGARSAVFAPLPRPGLIVVDEEHDPSYKHEGGLPYQARDVALYRGKLAKAAVLLVSATPAVTTYYRAKSGKYRYLNLSRRVTPQNVPQVELVNLKQERGRSLKIISAPLAAALQETLSRREQALLFLNRRGFSTVVFCLFCGKIFHCDHCSIPLTHHRGRDLLVCHYCGFTKPLPDRCPECQSSAVKRYGIGTEKVEAEVQRLFPEARVCRLDRDVAPHSGRGLRILEEFAAGKMDILVGTQMITKGHHFPNVTLVGAIAADQSLFFPEYHAGERTFQLMAQVAGRAGRGESPGRVLVQTYHPEHYVFSTIRTQDYEAFYEAELASRRAAGYPPFTRLALVRLSGPAEEAVAAQARRLADNLQRLLSKDSQLARLVRVLGPAPAGLAKLKGRFRWQLLLKSYGRPPLLAALNQVRRLWSPQPRGRIDLTLDIDPASLF